MFEGKRVSLVLGGGGMKGIAHIGVLKVLHRLGIEPDEYIGTSVGSLIGALAAGGLSPAEIEDVALALRRQDILDWNWLGLLFKRSRAKSTHRGKALHDFVRRVLPVDRFDDLKRPLFLTSVDLHSGREVVWGMPGLREVPIHDCVVASCSVPGVFPPKRIYRQFFVDGSIADTLPVKIAVYNKAELIFAVYLQSDLSFRGHAVTEAGMASIFEQSLSIWSRTLTRHNLNYFSGANIILIEPRIWNHGMFEFRKTRDVIEAGARAAELTLANHPLLPNLRRPGMDMETPRAEDLPRLLDEPWVPPARPEPGRPS